VSLCEIGNTEMKHHGGVSGLCCVFFLTEKKRNCVCPVSNNFVTLSLAIHLRDTNVENTQNKIL